MTPTDHLPSRPWRLLLPLAAMLTLALPAPSAAQDEVVVGDPSTSTLPSRWGFGIDFLVADPRGPFGDLVNTAWGFQLTGRFAPDPTGPVGLRLDLGLMRYGHESRDVCLPLPIGCRIGAEINTNNDIYFVGIGPEILFWERRLYAFGTVGTDVFSTSSNLSGLDSSEAILDTTQQEDANFTFRFGGGARIPLRSGPSPIHLELGVDYHRNGVAEYLVKGDIVDQPDGSITIYPNRSEANILAFRIGFSFGL